MKLQNEIELQNTRRKLAALEELMAAKDNEAPAAPAARQLTLQSMKSMAQKLRAEIEEYERTHQTA
jgi:hypothetical protein